LGKIKGFFDFSSILQSKINILNIICFNFGDQTIHKLFTMNCYNHPVQVAVAQCSDCGKGLCTQCASAYNIAICEVCSNQRISQEKRSIVKNWLLTLVAGLVVMFVLGVFLFTPGAEHKFRYFGYPMLFYISCGFLPGWRALRGVNSNTFVVLPVLGWVFYFVIKFILAIAIGWIVLPFKLVKDAIRFIQLVKMGKA